MFLIGVPKAFKKAESQCRVNYPQINLQILFKLFKRFKLPATFKA